MSKDLKYGCADYRKEMVLLNLRTRLKEKNLGEEEKNEILLQIRKLEKAMGLD